MKFHWINKKNNKNFILFMNGWGMNQNVVRHLDCSGYDILEADDYREVEFLFSDVDITGYENKILVCWSMGAYVANLFIENFKHFNKKIAISATNKMIDNTYGIPQKIYDCTIRYFSDESANKFIKNIFNNDSYDIEIERTTQELKAELISIKNLKTDSEMIYDKVIIPLQDKIVPSKNQLNYWKNKNTDIVKIESAHYVFNQYSSWREIVC